VFAAVSTLDRRKQGHGGWIAAVKAERVATLAGAASERARAISQGRLSEEAIKNMVQELGGMWGLRT
jgi:hypothetical protein